MGFGEKRWPYYIVISVILVLSFIMPNLDGWILKTDLSSEDISDRSIVDEFWDRTMIRTRPGLKTDIHDRNESLVIDCTEGAGKIILSNLTSVTIYGYTGIREKSLSISECDDVYILDSEIGNASLEIRSDHLTIEDSIFQGCSIRFDTWLDSDLLNSTFNDTTIKIENRENLKVHNNTFLNSTLWLTGNKNLTISENTFLGNRSKLRINLTRGETECERRLYSNIFESCTPGLHFTLYGWRDYMMWYNIYDNIFRNCSMAIVIEACDAYYNKIWRNTFYHNGGTGDQGAGKQISMTVRYCNVDTFYKNGIGNCWWNYRSPDFNNNSIVDMRLDLQVDRIIPTSGPIFDEFPLTGEFKTIFAPGVEIITPEEDSILRNSVNVKWRSWPKRYNVTSLDLRIDGGEWIDVLGMDSKKLDLNIGQHTISVRAGNEVGLTNITTVHFIVSYPDGSLVIDEPFDGQLLENALVHFSWRAPGIQNISAVEISLNTLKIDLDPSSIQADIPLGDGEFNAVLKAFDKEDFNATAEVNFTVDLTPPDVIILSPSKDTIISNPLVNFNWIVNDAVGISKLSFKVDRGEWRSVDPDIEHYQEMLGAGNHTFMVKATDLVGHVTYQNTSFTIGSDDMCIIAPSTNVITNKNQVHFRWKKPKWFDPTWTELRIEGTTRTYNVSLKSEMDVAIIDEGENKVVLMFHDKFDNYYKESRSVILDLDCPVIEFLNKSEFITENHIDVRWRGLDQFGIDHYELMMDGKIISDKILGTSTSVAGLTEGSHTLKIKAIDLAGNVGTSDWSFYVDLIPPSLEADLPINGSTIKGPSISISWEVSDENGLDDIQLSVDGKNTSFSKSGRKDVVLSSGRHKITITVLDNAGHSTQLSSRFNVDTDIPVLRWSIDTVDFLNSSEVTLEWYESDDIGIMERRIIVDGQLYCLADKNQTTLLLGEGHHSIMVEAYDVAGRMKHIHWKTYVDLLDPELGSLRPFIEDGVIALALNFYDNQSGIARISLWISGLEKAQNTGNFTYLVGAPQDEDFDVKVFVTDRSGRISEFDLIIPADFNGEPKDGGKIGSLLTWMVLLAAVFIIIACGIGAGIYIWKRSTVLGDKRLKQENDFFIQLKPAPPPSRVLPSKSPIQKVDSLPPKKSISRPLQIDGEYNYPGKKE